MATDVDYQLNVRGTDAAKGCFVDTTYEEKEFYGDTGGDRSIVNVSPYYRSKLHGKCGDYNGQAADDYLAF